LVGSTDALLGAAQDIVAAMRATNAPVGPSLAGGLAGDAVAFSHFAAATTDASAVAAADHALDAALAAAADLPLTGDLYAGVLGVGWALANVEHLRGEFDVTDERDDQLLAEKVLGARPWPGVHDLTRGLVGIGIHALELWPAPGARANLAAIVGCLAETAHTCPDGAYWWTDPITVLPERAAQFPDGYVDLGAAHGQAGVVALLAVAAALGIDGADALARDAARYVVSWRNKAEGVSRYPSLVVPRGAAGGARLAWCYGDAGVAWALCVAAGALADDELATEARATALGAARRPHDAAGAVDAGLCHGAFGIAHVLRRLGDDLGDDEVRDAARAWFEEGLAMRRDPSEGIAGFVARTPSATGTMHDTASTGLLEGAGGMALALLSAATDAPSPWDRFLLPQLPGA
jgi:class I lanthipeptide synthase